MQYKLNIEKRDGKVGLNTLRKAGKMPAIMYGPKNKAESIAVLQKDFIKIFEKAGESSVIELVEGNKEEGYESLIYEVDFDPIKDLPRHADFYIIEKGKKVQVAVPLIFEGTAPGVKEHGGILVKVIYELQIEAAPKDLPHEIKVDISSLLNIDSHIKAGEIKLPHNVSLKINPEDIVISVAAVKEEIEEAPKEIDMSAIEVEKKGKEAKEGEVVLETESAKDIKPSKETKEEKK